MAPPEVGAISYFCNNLSPEMSERIFTLFGEEIIPEQPKAQPKSRAKKKKEEDPAPAQPTGAAEVQATVTELPSAEVTTESVVNEPEITPEETTEEVALPVAEIVEAIAVETEPKVTEVTIVEEPKAVEVVEEIAVTQPDAATDTTTSEEEAEAATTTEEPQPEAEVKKTKKSKEVIKPEEPAGDKQYYTIGEVADLFKVKTSHIRFWTTEFKLKVRTTRKGDRLYSNEAIKELRAIHHLVKERGFTLAGAKTKLKEQKQVEVEAVDLKKSLTQLRNKLVAIKNQLK